MLGYEDGVIPHWGLLSIVDGVRGGKTLDDELARVLQDRRQAFFRQICTFVSAQAKAGSEFRSGQSCEEFIDVTHGWCFFRKITSPHGR